MKINIKQSLKALIFVPVLAFAASSAIAPMAGAVSAVDGVKDATKTAKLNKKTVTGSGGVFESATNALLYIIGAVSIIMIIVGGIRYVISNGAAEKITAAKNTILYAVIGLAIALLSYAIVNFVLNSL